MSKQRKHYSADLKARVVLEAIKGQRTANEIAAEYGIHPSQITQWKKHALDSLPYLFSTRASDQAKIEDTFMACVYQETLIARLYQQINAMKVQVNYLEKHLHQSVESPFDDGQQLKLTTVQQYASATLSSDENEGNTGD